MGFSSWLGKRQPSARSRCGSPTKRPRHRPRLEALEDRWLPSTFTVLNNLDSGGGSLRGEIAIAASGDTIVFDNSLAGQTIKLTSGELAITKSLTIDGLGADTLTISGNNAGRVFDISGSTTTVLIEDLTVANGFVNSTTVNGPLGAAALGGGILDNQATLALANVTLSNCQATNFVGGGGGVASVSGATLSVDSCTFTDNTAAGTSVNSPGGAILSDANSTLTVQNSTFSGNHAIDGGAIGVWGGSQSSITTSTFDLSLIHI